jgi:hypothetical protein
MLYEGMMYAKGLMYAILGIAKYDGQFAYVYAKRGQVRRYCSR